MKSVHITRLLVFLCCLTGWWLAGNKAAAQVPVTTLRGTVTDAETHQPIPAANVYLSGTTKGTTTDEKGNYVLPNVPQNTVELVVSFTGYEPFRQRLRPTGKPVDVALRITMLQELVVVAKRDKEWLQRARTVEKELLGQSPFAGDCRLLNAEVLSFTETAGVLSARAAEPLQFENQSLGYRITYQLINFRFEPGRGTFYAGLPLFTELTPTSDKQIRQWQRNRLQAYRGSLRHFMTALLQNRLEEEKFLVYREDITIPIAKNSVPMLSSELGNHLKPFDAQAALTAGQVSAERVLTSYLPLVVFYTPVSSRFSPYRDAQYAYSQLVFPQRSIDISTSGLIVKPNGFEARGYLSNDRLANALPDDWAPETPVNGTQPSKQVPQTNLPALTTSLIRPADKRIDSLRRAWNTSPVSGSKALFVHIDKPVYLTGDRIWCSVYALQRQTHQPDTSDTGPAVRLELWSANRQLVSQQWVAIHTGRGEGSVYLPDSLAGGVYQLRAYSDADRFSNRPAFERTISVLQSTAQSSSPASSLPVQGNLEIQILPEGGHMVAGLPVRLGIRAINAEGKGQSVQGHILNAAGQELTRFQTNGLGFGLAELTAAPAPSQQLTAKLQAPQNGQVTLPASLPEGLTLRTSLAADSSQILVRIMGSEAYQHSTAYLIAQSRGRVVDALVLGLSGKPAELTINTTKFPAGIAQLTVYDSLGRPQAERLVFIPERRPAIQAGFDLSSAPAANQTTITLRLSDGTPVPVQALLSVAVTSDAQVPADTMAADIPVHLLLTGELSGVVEQPRVYFRNRSRKTYQALDQVLLTQGWRHFRVQPVIDVAAKATQTGNITLRGQVVNLQNEPLNGLKMVLSVIGGPQWQVREVFTDKEGRFLIHGLVLTDSTQLRVQLSDASKREIKAKVIFDNNVGTFLPGPMLSPIDPVPATLTALLAGGRERQSADPALYRQAGSKLLKEVIVKAPGTDERPESIRRRSMHDRVDQTIIITDQKRAGQTSLYTLLRNLSGISVTEVDNKGSLAYNVRIYGVGPTAGVTSINATARSLDANPYTAKQVVSNTFSNPLFLIDGYPVQDDDGRQLLLFQAADIERIEILKSATASVYGVRGNNGIIAFYTRQGAGTTSNAGSTAFYKLPGYTVYRDFFTTRYPAGRTPAQPALQDVIGWFPAAFTDKQGRFEAQLPVPKLPARTRITIQGITPSGDPVSISQPLN
ncbi:carboxypeptidase regulatory-like domain-containing protein [Arsenicibacter rosenii]|uniref:TonB-dependent receptor plug domain-containing protein n=1 Tax=Arsenicibacter rosenii TaxID=1750698 RepID=A0A1S2VK34_9BACT|nr:carboxypeptidase regulatory-like domain-containing protein [Arsenicibacter rosenii]OIN59147.1 hypothetical protein BLX24_09105 [Arsenicibacter rosenii]